MFFKRNNRRRSLNTKSAQVSSEELEVRQLLSADGMIADCADGNNDGRKADESPLPESEALRRTDAGDVTGEEQFQAADYDALFELVDSTQHETAVEQENTGTDATNRTTPTPPSLSYITITGDANTHEKIVELLKQLRRLQDLQVNVEVHFIGLSDQFIERLGIDFDFNLSESIGDDSIDSGSDDGGNVLVTISQIAGVVESPDEPFGDDDLTGVDDLFVDGSTRFGDADFGGFDPQAASQFGFAILSDIEVFFLVQASQGDERANVLDAPRVTLFNGQTANMND